MKSMPAEPIKPEIKKYLAVLVVAVGLIIFFPPSRNRGEVEGLAVEDLLQFPVARDRQILKPTPLPDIPDLVLSAEGALVRARDSGISLYEKNTSKLLPIASLTKLLTAIVVWEKSSPEETLVIESQDTKVAPNKLDLRPGDEMRVIDLLGAMLVTSANDATLALARHTAGSVEKFVALMNSRARDLGMKSSGFSNPIGFDDPNHYSTVQDLSLLLEEFARHPELVEITRMVEGNITSVDGQHHYPLLTTNRLLLTYPEILGGKTGYTTEAKGNLILLVDPEDVQYSIIILGSQNREGDAEAIFRWVEENFVWN